MADKEWRAVFEVLVHVAHADGVLSSEEVARLRKAAADADVKSDVRPVMKLEQALAAIETQELRERALRMAIGMANADGHCSDAEKAMLDRIAKAFDLPQPTLVGHWAEPSSKRLVEVKARADEKFLHKVADALHDPTGLTQERYEELVEQLRAEVVSAA